MSRVRTVFMGTPSFAVPSLEALAADEHFEVVGVVTQPDRPAGRKLELQPSPVKKRALELGFKVWTPEKLNRSDDLQEIGLLGADVGVVVAFGQLLSEQVLTLFPLGCVNVHGSLLPKWRGAAPMQRSLMAGDEKTGVCLQKMVKRLDAGDVLGFREVDVPPTMDAQELHQVLSQKACELLHVELMDYVRGNLVGTPQDETQVSFAAKIDKAEGDLDWRQGAQTLANQVRGLALGPPAFSCLPDGSRIKILRVLADSARAAAKVPGTVLLESGGGRVLVCCGPRGGERLELVDVQPASRARMAAVDWWRGQEGRQAELVLTSAAGPRGEGK